jgi:hypothetical protein
MSLTIEVSDVVGVLLQDGWHPVADGSFEIGEYEFVDRNVVWVGGRSVEGVSAAGATWKEPTGEWLACPFTQIVAVRYKPGGN